ncbi:MAG: AmmeMemoRadiSam system radical SAM enzyme [Thermodesulfovibrionales bacterium]|nr:AmmeMemoRadiSam system radical SAM enzyme [Thermodesulfovibrionales bacterium]
MKEARFYEKLDDLKVKCYLCAHGCVISSGKRGICSVRENREGTLYSLVYGKVIAKHIDPIEKKPLFHFFPGSKSYSIATVGCNFKCKHCQNYQISQFEEFYDSIPGEDMTPEEVVLEAEKYGCQSISYTYTEPTIFMEFAYDCAKLAHERGIKNVFVSNGYTSEEAIRAIAPYLDANNIDLKGDDNFYRKIVGAKLQPVLETIKLMKDLGVWVEVTTLIIPTYNDSEDFLSFVVNYLKSIDENIPWHVSQFYPTYLLTDQPRTPYKTLKKARELGIKLGLKYVYEGNVYGSEGENTFCPVCKEVVIERKGFTINKVLMKNSRCIRCNALISGIGMP